MNRLFPLLLASMPAAAALAATEGHHEGHQGVPWGKLLFSTINLLIFLFILRRFAWPAIRDWLKQRRDQIVGDLESAARAKRQAEQLQAEWKARLANLATEIAAMRQQAESEIAAEREQILAAAARMADAIRKDAEKVAAQELRGAQGMLRAEVARQALAIASRTAPGRLSADDQRRFVDEFLQQAGG